MSCELLQQQDVVSQLLGDKPSLLEGGVLPPSRPLSSHEFYLCTANFVETFSSPSTSTSLLSFRFFRRPNGTQATPSTNRCVFSVGSRVLVLVGSVAHLALFSVSPSKLIGVCSLPVNGELNSLCCLCEEPLRSCELPLAHSISSEWDPRLRFRVPFVGGTNRGELVFMDLATLFPRVFSSTPLLTPVAPSTGIIVSRCLHSRGSRVAISSLRLVGDSLLLVGCLGARFYFFSLECGQLCEVRCLGSDPSSTVQRFYLDGFTPTDRRGPVARLEILASDSRRVVGSPEDREGYAESGFVLFRYRDVGFFVQFSLPKTNSAPYVMIRSIVPSENLFRAPGSGSGPSAPTALDASTLPVGPLSHWRVSAAFPFHKAALSDDGRLGVLLRDMNSGQVAFAESSLHSLCCQLVRPDGEEAVDVANWWGCAGVRRRRSFIGLAGSGSLQQNPEPLSEWRLDASYGRLFQFLPISNYDGLGKGPGMQILAAGTSSNSSRLRTTFNVFLKNGVVQSFLVRSPRQCLLDRISAFARNPTFSPERVFDMRDVCARAGILDSSLDAPMTEEEPDDDSMDVDRAPFNSNPSPQTALSELLSALWRQGHARFFPRYIRSRRNGSSVASSPFVLMDPVPVFEWVRECVHRGGDAIESLVGTLLRSWNGTLRPALEKVFERQLLSLRSRLALFRDLVRVVESLQGRFPPSSDYWRTCGQMLHRIHSLLPYGSTALWLADSGLLRSFRASRVTNPARGAFLVEPRSVPSDMSHLSTARVPVVACSDMLWGGRNDDDPFSTSSYPPTSLEELVSILLSPDSSYELQRAALFYYVIDYAFSVVPEDEEDDSVDTTGFPERFKRTFGLSTKWESLVFGLWALDQIMATPLEDLNDPDDVEGRDRRRTQHQDVQKLAVLSDILDFDILNNVIRLLLLRHTPDSLRTAQIILRARHGAVSPVLEVMVAVKRGDYRSAFLRQRGDVGEEKRLLLYIMLDAMREKNQLKTCFSFSLSVEEETLYVAYLKSHDAWRILNDFYLSQSRFYEAMKLSEMMNDTKGYQLARSLTPEVVLSTFADDLDPDRVVVQSDDAHAVRERLEAAVGRLRVRMRCPPKVVRGEPHFDSSRDYNRWLLRGFATRNRKRKRDAEEEVSRLPPPTDALFGHRVVDIDGDEVMGMESESSSEEEMDGRPSKRRRIDDAGDAFPVLGVPPPPPPLPGAAQSYLFQSSQFVPPPQGTNDDPISIDDSSSDEDDAGAPPAQRQDLGGFGQRGDWDGRGNLGGFDDDDW